MKKLKPRARGRSFTIKRPTCHIAVVVKDISLDKYQYMGVEFIDSFRCSKNLNRKTSIQLPCILTKASGPGA